MTRGVDADTPADQWPEAYVGDGVGMNSTNDEVSLDGLPTSDAKQTDRRLARGERHGEPSVTYKLRDWLFSRQRYWGEPFPIVYDDDGDPIALPESMLPVELPEIDRLRAAHPRRRRPVTARAAARARGGLGQGRARPR